MHPSSPPSMPTKHMNIYECMISFWITVNACEVSTQHAEDWKQTGVHRTGFCTWPQYFLVRFYLMQEQNGALLFPQAWKPLMPVIFFVGSHMMAVLMRTYSIHDNEAVWRVCGRLICKTKTVEIVTFLKPGAPVSWQSRLTNHRAAHEQHMTLHDCWITLQQHSRCHEVYWFKHLAYPLWTLPHI